MGGTTQTTQQNTSQNQFQNAQQAQSGQSTAQLSPFGPAAGFLSGLPGQVGGISPNLSPEAQAALGQLYSLGGAGNPFQTQIGGVASTLLGGGGANSFAPLYQGALSQYSQQLSPFLNPNNLNPYNTPGFGNALSTLNTDITNQINSQFAGAGRDLSGMNAQTLARGLAQGEGGLIQGQYNQNVANMLGSAGNLFGATGGTAGALAGLNQTSLGNMLSGIGAAGSATQAQQYGPLLALQAQSIQTGIPLQVLAQQAGILGPLAAQFGTQAGTTAGTGSFTGSGYGTGQSTTQQQVPFNPWSLAPLALMPLTGGASAGLMGGSSLAGMALGKLFG